jgi:hypothetical protein
MTYGSSDTSARRNAFSAPGRSGRRWCTSPNGVGRGDGQRDCVQKRSELAAYLDLCHAIARPAAARPCLESAAWSSLLANSLSSWRAIGNCTMERKSRRSQCPWADRVKLRRGSKSEGWVHPITKAEPRNLPLVINLIVAGQACAQDPRFLRSYSAIRTSSATSSATPSYL